MSFAKAADDFPVRSNYPHVKTIALDDLYKKRNSYTIVDTRSKYEYSVLHIKNAVNIPLSSFDFTTKVNKLYADNRKTIVFYCNGHTCTKSYEAVLKTKRMGKLTDTLAFDGGIYDWVKRYPKASILLNEARINVDKLISEEEFKKHLLKPKAFLDKSNNKCIVLDVRDSLQRKDRIFAGFEKPVNLDNTNKLNDYIAEAKAKKNALCIYDAVGKQVRWLQYYLKEKKMNEYYFLEGGAKAFYAVPYKELYGTN
ncbi:MAG: rhodanese-like domain-containing protein [Gammaproteobacteria bacterium]|nr:rhodanese-like domain-containing protein [Gammaproteobacteria bacterium]